MRDIIAVSLFLVLACGCTQPEQKVDFKFNYLLMDKENQTTEGPVGDSFSFPRDSTYFHIRMNITSRDNITHHLMVLDQESDIFQIRLPLYLQESINGFNRTWTDITGVSGGRESLVPLEPGKEKALEQPVFFFNQMVSPGMSPKLELKIAVVNATGSILGTRTITIRITED